MKNIIKKYFLVLLITMVVLPSSISHASSVNVKVPNFEVTLNGVKVDNSYNQYPLLTYKDITYIPLTCRHARFLGLKTTLNIESKIYFLGISEEMDKEFKTYNTNLKNKNSYIATIPDYKIGINQTSELLNNPEEDYPFLKFRDIVYFPLTWRNSKEILGWDYKWSQEKGLEIDSRETERPVVDGSLIHSQSPNRGLLGGQYVYREDFYIRYPKSTFNDQYEFIYKKDGQDIQKFNFRDELSGGDYYFNQQVNEDGYVRKDPVLQPKVEGNIFSLPSVKQKQALKKNILIEIDLNKGTIVDIKEI